MSLTEEARLEDELATLRAAHDRNLRKLEALKKSKEDLALAMRTAVADALQSLVIPPVEPPKRDARQKNAETAICVLSDWQLGKVTATYNSQICEERIERYADKVIELTEIQRADHPVKECRVYLIGDMVEGELIFPGQSHLIDSSLYMQAIVDGPRIMANLVRKMSANFEKVRVVCVPGNHGSLGGRARHDMHPESNADRMAYKVAEQIVLPGTTNVEWYIADSMSQGPKNEAYWYAIDHVGDKSFFLFHGHQIKGGFGGFPWYGFGKKVLGWSAGAVPEHFDYALAGHFHTPTKMTLNYTQLWVNGTTESANVYAQEQLAAAGRPCQLLLFSHPKRGVTAEYLVWLDDD